MRNFYNYTNTLAYLEVTSFKNFSHTNKYYDMFLDHEPSKLSLLTSILIQIVSHNLKWRKVLCNKYKNKRIKITSKYSIYYIELLICM